MKRGCMSMIQQEHVVLPDCLQSFVLVVHSISTAGWHCIASSADVTEADTGRQMHVLA